MKDTVRRLMIIHGIVLVVAAVGGVVLWKTLGLFSALAGVLAFSIPVVVFSTLVLRASAGDPKRFWGRFIIAELLKWASAGVLLAVSFVTTLFLAPALLAGFLLSVLVQVFFPIFVRREN